MKELSHPIRQGLIEALAQSAMLKYLGHNHPHAVELREMLECSEVQIFTKGTVIIREGHSSDRMFLLAGGKVKISRNGKTIATLARLGDVFGEFGALTGEVRSATVTAVTNVSCLATNPDFTSHLLVTENIVFIHLLHQALTKILMGRLNQAADDLAETKESIKDKEEEILGLKKRNELLEAENLKMKRKLQEGLAWPHSKKGKK